MLKNILKILSETIIADEHGHSSKDQETSLKGVRKEMINIKKDVKAIRRDINVICEYIKLNKK